MIILLTIFQYFIQTINDVLDKFLITQRKIEPINYTFYTVVTGLVLLLIWPWYFTHISWAHIVLSLLAGACFSLALYVFYIVLSDGEVSRVIPFVFGLVPLFDILIGVVSKTDFLKLTELAALALLIPGALLMGYKKGKLFTKHVGLKIFAAFLFSVYYFLWHAASHNQPVLNSLMWNRIGAAVVMVPLLIPSYTRNKILKAEKVKQKKHTTALFLFKQALGGANFVFGSYLLAVGIVPIFNALQGFRYIFLFITALFLSKGYRHVIDEDINRHIIRQKVVAIIMICAGTVILFLS